MDLSKLSTDDLRAIQGGDLSKVSTEGLQMLRASASAPPPAATQPPQVSQSVGSMIRDVPKQVGLTARYALEGPARAAEIVTEPIRQILINPALRIFQGSPSMSDLVTGKQPFQIKSLSEGATALADTLGLPSPQTADERVVADATRLLAGGGTVIGGAQRAGQAANGLTKTALDLFAARPAAQLTGAAAAGVSGGSVREAGGSPAEQAAAAFVGAVAGGAGAQKLGQAATAAVQKTKAALTPPQVKTERADREINLVLERAGIDWSGVPERIRQSLRAEVADALDTGRPLNADALRRLLAFKKAGVTPTVGQLTQDPGQITREMNLAKTGANSTDLGLQRLPALQNQNTATLLRQLDETGAARAPDAIGAGRTAISSLDANVASTRKEIGDLYTAARDSAGRSLPLETGTFTTRASQLLDEANVGSFLPADIRNKLNQIAQGKPGYELTVDAAEQLKTSIGSLQRGSSDGNVRRALGLVRQALDETPLQNDRLWNPGNVPAVSGSVPTSTAAAGREAVDAFNAARSANRAFMQRVERNPALKAVVDGVEPDQFVQKYVIGSGASAANVRALREELGPEAVEQMRQHLVKHLRDAATNSTDDITKFSNAGFRLAFRNLEAKLPAFFTKGEIDYLKNLGEVAKYMQAQPAGSAVNNSSSGALVLGRGIDLLERAANYIPFGGRDIVKGWLQGQQQTQVLEPRNALISILKGDPPPSRVPLSALLTGSVVRPAEAREHDRAK